MQAINKIILGTVQFGLKYGVNNTYGKPNQDVVNKILDAAYKSGIHYLDTAEAYGNAHDIIGQYHYNNPGQTFNIITKLPASIAGELGHRIEKYLQELKIVQLYGLLFHSYQTYKENDDAIAILDSYKQSGKVKYIGVSVYTNEQAEDVIQDERIDIIQLPFNLFDNLNLRGEVLKKAKANGKMVHTRSAFLQGLFFMPLKNGNKTAQSLHEELASIHQLSNYSNIPLQKIALNYCLQHSAIDNVLIGVDNLDQLKQNLNYADYSLSEGIINKINEIHIKNINLLNPSLWGQ